MNIYNTLTRRVERFTSVGSRVGVYTCGITPYDTTHLGHAFTYAVSDVLIRYLEHQGYEVTYVQNVTDIDDDILRKADQVGEDWRELGNRWTAHFIHDMVLLNIRPPDHFPRATSVINDIHIMAQHLVEQGVAYVSGGNVYFDVSRWEEFGKLSGLARDEMLPVANERGNRPDDPNKRSPLDFVLWQAQEPGEPAWDSPWGPGRPGWHIECSTMSTRYLGRTIDFHLGGSDLVFPHHECEIAHVEPLQRGTPFVRYWMHAAMVQHEGEKMSKSLGNLVMVRDLLESYSADALRIYLALHHYRRPWSHDETELQAAARLAHRLRAALSTESGSGPAFDTLPYRQAFETAMDADLNTPEALQALDGLAGEVIGSSRKIDLEDARATLQQMAAVIGLRHAEEQPDSRVVSGWEKHLAAFSVVS